MPIQGPTPQNFITAAQRAQSVGGAVSLNKQGHPVVKVQGHSWRGKAVSWEQGSVISGKPSRRDNMRTLAAFQKALDQQYGVSSKDIVSDISLESPSLVSDLKETVQAFETSSQLSKTAVPQGNAYAEKLRGDPEALKAVCHLAGKTPQGVSSNFSNVQVRYRQFLSGLAQNPLIAEGCIAHGGLNGADMRALGAHVYRDAQGNFEEGFLKAVFVTTLEKAVPPVSTLASPSEERLPEYGVQGKYAEEDLAWVRNEYNNVFARARRTIPYKEPTTAAPKSTPKKDQVPTTEVPTVYDLVDLS